MDLLKSSIFLASFFPSALFLNEICDFEKYHRKMILEVLHPYELYNLHLTYVQINKLLI